MNNQQITVKEHVEAIFDEFKERYVSDRINDLAAFADFKSGLDEKTKLQAAEYERRLTAYPTIKDFNELKEKVTVEFSAALGKGKVLALLFSGLSVIISTTIGLLVYFKS